MIQTLKFVFGKAEDIVGEGEGDGYQYSLTFPQCFHKLLTQGSLKS